MHFTKEFKCNFTSALLHYKISLFLFLSNILGVELQYINDNEKLSIIFNFVERRLYNDSIGFILKREVFSLIVNFFFRNDFTSGIGGENCQNSNVSKNITKFFFYIGLPLF